MILDGPIVPMLAWLSAPNIVVVMLQTTVSIAEAWYVGHLGTTALAAVALVFPLQALMQMMSAGAMGGGISSAVGRALGGER
ncbi:MAG: MATE family efflux transporter, partial [Gammaproteobacteria bacterium]|nr:MATE family efflux transporter [Gammaproteobacteria bacterium]